MPTPTVLDDWLTVARNAQMTTGMEATRDQLDAALRSFAEVTGVELTPPVLAGMTVGLMAVQTVQLARWPDSHIDHPDWSNQVCDALGWVQYLVALRLAGTDLPTATWGDDEVCDFLAGVLRSAVDEPTAQALAVNVRDALRKCGAYITSVI